jgi:hypothetical protein
MKTFSAMSIPDKRLTLYAYKQLSLFFKTQTETPGNLPSEIKENFIMQAYRLQQLMEALEADLLSE